MLFIPFFKCYSYKKACTTRKPDQKHVMNDEPNQSNKKFHLPEQENLFRLLDINPSYCSCARLQIHHFKYW